MNDRSPGLSTRTGHPRASRLLGACVLLGLVLAGKASAQDSPWSLRAGPVGVYWDESTEAKVAGVAVPGAEIDAENNYSLAFDLGYDLGERWTVRFAFGVPPTADLHTAGTLDAMVPPLTGKLGEVKYGPAVLTAVYKFNANGRFVPYIGAGVTYVRVFSTEDGDVQGLDIDDAFGSALQAGFNVPLKDRWSLFLDVRKLFVDTEASGTLPALGGPPAAVSIDLDPLIVHTGIEYRF
jgi:outer membrane protein